MHAKQIIIIADERLDVKGAVINGKEIKVEAEVLTIEQVLDTVRSEYNSDGISAGITVTWSGAVVPYGSFNHGDGVKQSQVVRFLSSISGESVDVTAKHLIYNIATITASKELKVTADNIAYTPMPEGENVDQETRIMMAFSVGSDGKLRGSVAGSHRDGDFVVSGGYFSSFFEGLEIIKSWGDVINPPPNQKQIELQQKLQGLTDQLIDKQLELELKKVSEEDKPKLIELTKEIKAIKNGVIIVRPLPPLEGSNVLSGTDAEQSNAKAIAHAIAAAVNKYAIFSEKHPVLAKHGLTMLNVAAQTLLGGVVGLVNSVKSELVAYGIDKTTGEYTTAALDWMITEASIVTKNKYPELTYQEAKTLAAATLIGTGMFVAGSIAIKHIFKEIHELHFPYFLRHGDDLAYAGGGSHKKSWFDADANDNVLMKELGEHNTDISLDPNYMAFGKAQKQLRAEFDNMITKLEKSDIVSLKNNVHKYFNNDAPIKWNIAKEVLDKIPSDLWNAEIKANNKGIGIRFSVFDEGNNNLVKRIRIDQGIPDSKIPSQRVDHVEIFVEGKYFIDVNGKKVLSSEKHKYDVHIPIEKWQNWRHIDKP